MDPYSVLIGGGIIVAVVYTYYSFRQYKIEMQEGIYHTAYPVLELVDGVVYAHDQNGEFIGQGATHGELMVSISMNLPRKGIFIAPSELEKVGFNVK